MNLKTLANLNATLLASSSLINDVPQSEINEIIRENQVRNVSYLKTYPNLNSPIYWSKGFKEGRSRLSLPVNLIIYDKYYSRLSEWKYWDEYQYDRNILVFNHKEYTDSEKFRNFYKKYWLQNISHSKKFRYFQTNLSQYPMRDESQHINWISGGASSHTLSNILSLKLPEKVVYPFEKHMKVIELDHSFLMSHIIPLYSGYWKSGKLNKAGNVKKEVIYGNLKANSRNWSDIYHNYSNTSLNCDAIGRLNNLNFKDFNSSISEGFDSKCDQINLYNHWSFFYNRMGRNIYSSGFVGYKEIQPEYWNKQYYFYSLGEWSLDKPMKYRVNMEKEDKSIWYINYDNLFMPEFKVVNKNIQGKSRRMLQLSIYLDYSKITKNISHFLDISSGLNFQFKFNVGFKRYIVNFRLVDILSLKKFSILDSFIEKNIDNLSFHNLNIFVHSNNSRIQLLSPFSGEVFKFEPNLSLIRKNFSIFTSLHIHYSELQNYYFFELNREKIIRKIFNLYRLNSGKFRYSLESLPRNLIRELQLKVSWDTLTSKARIEYFDFIEGKKKREEVDSLLKLPKFENQNFAVREDKFSRVEEIITSQSKERIGASFWEIFGLKLIEHDILNGEEKYILYSKKSEFPEYSKEVKEIISSYQNMQFILKNKVERLISVNLENSNSETLFKEGKYEQVFKLDSLLSQKYNLNFKNFEFKKSSEDDQWIELEMSYLPNSEGSRKVESELHSIEVDKVKIYGKKKFKFNKTQNYLLDPDHPSSPIYLNSSILSNKSKSLSTQFYSSLSPEAFFSILGLTTSASSGFLFWIGSNVLKRSKLVSS